MPAGIIDAASLMGSMIMNYELNTHHCTALAASIVVLCFSSLNAYAQEAAEEETGIGALEEIIVAFKTMLGVNIDRIQYDKLYEISQLTAEVS